MDKEQLSGQNKIRAIVLAHELKAKMEAYWFLPPQDERIAETQALERQIEDLGFLLRWNATVNTQIPAIEVDITLFLPKQMSDREWEKNTSALSPEILERLKRIREAAVRSRRRS